MKQNNSPEEIRGILFLIYSILLLSQPEFVHIMLRLAE